MRAGVRALPILPSDEGKGESPDARGADAPGRRSYDAAFRADAVARATARGSRISDVAAELKVSPSTLRRWVKAGSSGGPAPPPTASSAPAETPATGPPGRDDTTVARTTGADLNGLEAPVTDTDRRPPMYDEPSLEGSSRAAPRDPLAADSTRDVLSGEPRTTPGATATPDEDPWASPAPEPNPASKLEDPNVLAMLDAILEMFPKPGTAPRAGELTEPGPAAHRAVEPERDRIPLHPGDDIFPGVAALVPAYRFPIILAYLLGAIGVSRFVPLDYPLRPVALALHIISLVIAFGAVLVIDWHGLLWLLGRRGLTESTRLAAAAGPLIWGGLFGLIASGALLHPNLSSPLTLLKLFLVLMVAWNGAAMSTLRRRMAQLPSYVKPGDLPWRDWAMLMSATVISQVGWWGAILIGFYNSST